MPPAMPALRALLSDLDGTLLDTEPLYFNAYLATAQHYGREWTPAQHTEFLLGRPQQAGIEKFLEVLGLSATATVEDVLRHRDAILEPAFSTSVELLPGAARAVEACARAGLRCAIVTSSKRALLEMKARRSDIAAFLCQFELIVCNDDDIVLGMKGKPAPDPYLAAAGALGLLPSQCMVWEDSLAGVQAGKSAGCVVVAVPGAGMPKEVFAEAKPHVSLASLQDFDLQGTLALCAAEAAAL